MTGERGSYCTGLLNGFAFQKSFRAYSNITGFIIWVIRPAWSIVHMVTVSEGSAKPKTTIALPLL